jgi:hypothetical protein
MSLTAIITLALQGIVTIGGLIANHWQAKQTPAEQANAQAATDAKLQAQAEADVAKGDLTQLGKDAS